MEIIELRSHLVNECNINPLEIFLMKTNNNSIHSALYLIHLNKNNATFENCRAVKAINHTIVKWSHYKPKYRGPTICNKCSTYGHGASNCNRVAHCLLCAGNHQASNCGLRANENRESIVYKCYNCSKSNKPSNHKASDITCPFRQQYLEIRHKANNRNKQNIQTKTQQPRQDRQPLQARQVRQPTATPITHSMRTTTINTRPNRINRRPTYADQVKYGPESDDNDEELYSMSELFSIFKNAVSKIKQCKNKLDQISVIASLLEYAV